VTRVLLLSTYELGGQPLGLSGPASALLAAGHDVRAHDLAVEDWPTESVEWADAVACSVPMHTALRLGLAAIERVRTDHPEVPVAYYGLYAPIAAELDVLGPDDLAVADGALDALVQFADRLGPAAPAAPAAVTGRSLLPALSEYARYLDRDGERLVGPVESTVGCNHRCRHCPVPLVFDGRSRATPLDEILADVEALVDLGATHVHFADPDFLNRPQHALRVSNAIHVQYPDVTLDATIKVSHILRYPSLLPELAGNGLRFVISAFESTSDLILSRLDKGHTCADLAQAVTLLRGAGIEPRPSFLPFTPWTTRDDLVALLDFVAANDLIPNVDGVQYGIRLLLPPRSLLLDRNDPILDASIGEFDESDLGITWTSADPLLDEIADEIAQIAEEAAEEGASAEETYATVRAATLIMLGRTDTGLPKVTGTASALGSAGAVRPHLTEAWFCCAEPRSSQLNRVTERAPAQTWVPISTPVTLRTRPR
jgi:hypothetical protein